jgi:cephalosporin hydroxylase
MEERLGQPLLEHWRHRIYDVFSDRYAGVLTMKFPEDLRVYEHLLWDSGADVVIEIGCHSGGSALWFRDRLEALRRYRRAAAPARVVSIDLDTAPARKNLVAVDPAFEETIALLDGDVTDPGLPERVAALLPDGARCLVVEDSAHTYETTSAALRGFARFVPSGGWFVVEDGCVDIEPLRLVPDWPRGVLPAIADWLATPEGTDFRVRREAERYGLTCHPGGFLQRNDNGVWPLCR